MFEEEPLATDSPLWAMNEVILTPHAAGGRPDGAEDLVLGNVQRFLHDEPLVNVVDRERGY